VKQSVELYLWLVPLGFAVGAYGTLIGAGGGFVLIPILLLLYPDENPELLTSISLAVVFFNALSGSWAYAKMKRIDYKSGVLFSSAIVPGAILGALTTAYVPRRLFDAAFGALMILASAFLQIYPTNYKERKPLYSPRYLVRSCVEADGTKHVFAYNLKVGIGLSLIIGYVSSMLGIGGGIIHVPVLIHLLNFPLHIATATSHFILVIMAFTGTIVHFLSSSFSHGIHRTVALAIGVFMGAQLGALLSKRIQGRWIIRILAIALGFVGIRIFLLAW
jgi:uncharacterized membrane protein YfcA